MTASRSSSLWFWGSFFLLTLDKLDVSLLDDVQFDGTVVIDRLVLTYFAEIILQILRLEAIAVISQNLIAQQA